MYIIYKDNSSEVFAELDYDNTYALGPENITVLDNAPAGTYEVYVKYYSYSVETAVTATVKLFKDDVEIDSQDHSFLPEDESSTDNSYEADKDWYVTSFVIP